jgi:hypothetical protein
MQYAPVDTPAEADVRLQGYRLEVVSHWPASPRKVAAAEAISQRLTTIARSALVRDDIADLLHLTCKLLDDFFTADSRALNQPPSTDKARNAWPGVPKSAA